MAPAVIWGLIIGLLGGLIGPILSTLRIPALIQRVGEAGHRADATNLVVGFWLGVAAVIGHLPGGGIDRSMMLIGSAASIPGALVRSRITGRLSEQQLRNAIAVALLVSAEPLSSPNRTPEQRVEVIDVLRRLRMTGAEIAEVIGMPLSTVSAVLTRIGLGKLTNGKAERFIRTMLSGWAYGAIYGTSSERTAALPGWLDYYNRRRPHGSLSHQPPLTRLHATRNNVPGSYI